MRHLTIDMRPPGADYKVGIDVGISKLIKALWQAEIHTVNSCQDRAEESTPKPGIAWIEFATPAGGMEFLDIVQGDGISYQDWQIDHVIHDESNGAGAHNHHLSLSIRYPFEQTDELAKRVRSYIQFLKSQHRNAA